MSRRLHIDYISFDKLTQELGNSGEVEGKIIDFICDNQLHMSCSDDSAAQEMVTGFEAGYVAAQAGVDHITVIEEDTPYGWNVTIMPGSSEKLCRDLTAHLKGE